jgi:hypothetical protein
MRRRRGRACRTCVLFEVLLSVLGSCIILVLCTVPERLVVWIFHIATGSFHAVPKRAHRPSCIKDISSVIDMADKAEV